MSIMTPKSLANLLSEHTEWHELYYYTAIGSGIVYTEGSNNIALSIDEDHLTMTYKCSFMFDCTHYVTEHDQYLHELRGKIVDNFFDCDLVIFSRDESVPPFTIRNASISNVFLGSKNKLNLTVAYQNQEDLLIGEYKRYG